MEEHEEAVREIRKILEKVAADQGTVAYSEVVSRVKPLHLERDSPLFAQMLDEISRQSDSEGRGMLSAVVVHKGDDRRPGDGFFKLGRELGRGTSDRIVFHAEELQRVHDSYAR
jgi:hypothetical protein